MFKLIDHNTGIVTDHDSLEDCITTQEGRVGSERNRNQYPHYSIYDGDTIVKRVYAGQDQSLTDTAGKTGPDIQKLADAYSELQKALDLLQTEVARQNDRIAVLEAAKAETDEYNARVDANNADVAAHNDAIDAENNP